MTPTTTKERNCMDTIYRVCLVDPQGHFYEKIDYVNQDGKPGYYFYMVTDKAEIDAQFQTVTHPRPPWDWPGPAGSVAIMEWDPKKNHDQWHKIQERKARKGEFDLRK